MYFFHEGRQVSLQGNPSLEVLSLPAKAFRKLLNSESSNGLYTLHYVADQEILDSHDLSPELRQVLQQFENVFREPTQLPLRRHIDHRIDLLPTVHPVNVRPYRYPHFQKTEMEKLVDEMLKSGVIRDSRSSFSSPVLLVKKKDGGWRFCVDYRALNAITVKDKFPIPTIDEILDELHGATIFSKLDLRSGYHQIRMKEEDIHKTAFRTHMGHYEFVVMPFGLTNAPATFQATMNQLFKPYLRHFVAVFFDDILIYSATLQDHLQQLAVVLRLLHEKSFFAKLSKCSFAQTSIAYLGHVVSGDGVRVDPQKIEAITKWPEPTSVKQLRGFLVDRLLPSIRSELCSGGFRTDGIIKEEQIQLVS